MSRNVGITIGLCVAFAAIVTGAFVANVLRKPVLSVDRLREEGTFLLCTFWLAEALALAGELDRARATFERAIAFVNDVGLLSEEVDATTGELLGNFPQTFTHLALINAAVDLDRRLTASNRGGVQ